MTTFILIVTNIVHIKILLVMTIFMSSKALQCYRAKTFIHKRWDFKKQKNTPSFFSLVIFVEYHEIFIFYFYFYIGLYHK